MKMDYFDGLVLWGVILFNIGIFATFDWQIGLIIIGISFVCAGIVGARNKAGA